MEHGADNPEKSVHSNVQKKLSRMFLAGVPRRVERQIGIISMIEEAEPAVAVSEIKKLKRCVRNTDEIDRLMYRFPASCRAYVALACLPCLERTCRVVPLDYELKSGDVLVSVYVRCKMLRRCTINWEEYAHSREEDLAIQHQAEVAEIWPGGDVWKFRSAYESELVLCSDHCTRACQLLTSNSLLEGERIELPENTCLVFDANPHPDVNESPYDFQGVTFQGMIQVVKQYQNTYRSI